MAPIETNSIRVETWHMDGKVKRQVIADGDAETPGVFRFERRVMDRNAGKIRGRNIVGPIIDKATEKVVEEPSLKGVWTRLKTPDEE